MADSKNILLLEPRYKNKYPPLGLMKIAQYHRQQNKKHNIVFAKGEDDPKLYDCTWDRIYITTLFSFEWKRTADCIDKAVELIAGKPEKIFVGGISASLMTDEFCAIEKWKGIRFIQGILQDNPTTALKLKHRDFGKNDAGMPPIDEMPPDYSILEHIDYKYPTHDAYFGYASRGCIRKCAFCGVPKLEGEQKDMPPVTSLITEIDRLYGQKKDLILMDNNVTAAPKFKEIMAEIRDLGFTPGAKLQRDKRYYKRRVDFNQGVDARLLAKNPELLRELATICISPLRIAFDHWGVRKPYEAAIREAAQNNLTSLSNYMLYNFYDDPTDLYKRLALNIELNQELGIKIWSFPMRYQPITLKDRTHVGKKWNRYFLRSFQVILQATHGVVTGNPKFFNWAFGDSMDSFMMLLAIPHEFIFNRNYYFKEAGRPVLDDFFAHWHRLRVEQQRELINLLSGPSEQKGLKPSMYKNYLFDASIDKKIRDILRFYVTYNVTGKRVNNNLFAHRDLYVPADEKVEDAGLYDDEDEVVFVAAQ